MSRRSPLPGTALWICSLFLCVSGTVASAAEGVRAVLYSPHAAKLDCNMTMGPTGATAWMRGYEFQVVSIAAGSPADGVLELGDVVVAANGVRFGPDADPRITLGNAIGTAEVEGQRLKLTVVRGDDEVEVSLELARLGPFSATWPADCSKSDRILDTACRRLREAQLPSGEVITDGAMGTFLTGLLLLASGDPEYLDAARRAAYHATEIDYESMHYNNWPMGYGGLLLAEYYLATGDDSVLPKLAEIADTLGKGQMKCGSWGHKSPGAGYGALNQPGIICAITLVLAQECGIEVDQDALRKALTFFGRYAMLGAVPYGDSLPSGEPDHNGRNASSGVLMRLAGQDDRASAFARSVAMSYWRREEGHTGGFFSMLWGPLGASMAGEDEFRTFLDYQRWYYNLCRTWQGDLTLLPFQEALTRFDSSGYVYFGGDFTNGGMALVFALPAKRLRILGAPQSVFSPHAELDGALLTARDQYLARDWAVCDATLASISAADLAGERERRWLSQLKDARALAMASVDLVLVEVESNLVEGAAYRASEQYAALKQCLGDSGDPRFEELDERFEKGSVPWYVREGKQYYEAWHKFRGFSVRSWVPQGWQARRMTEGLPTLRQPIWEPLSPTSQLTRQQWRTLLPANGESLPEGWEQIGFDDSSWKQSEGITLASKLPKGEGGLEALVAARRRFSVEDPSGVRLRVRLQTVRPARTRVFLNGELIVDAVRGQRGGHAAVELDATAFGLLKTGENLLAVTSTRQGPSNHALDVGLDIQRQELEKRHLPVHRARTLVRHERPGEDFTLRVRETQGKMQEKLMASFESKSFDALLKDLESPVAFRRGLAEAALVKKGREAVLRTAESAGHADWRVRSAVCNVIGRAQGAHRRAVARAEKIRKAKGEEATEVPEDIAQAEAAAKVEMEFLKPLVPTLTDRVNDEHYWVRTRAAFALREFGNSARSAVPVLMQRVSDPDEWVRIAAIGAIRTTHEDPDTGIAAALKATQTPNTGYTVLRNALGLLRKYPEGDRARLDALVNVLRHPPEGGGGRLLNETMDMAVKLDPDGRQVVPVLIEIVADRTHYSRQRGNPRGKAVDVLASYGTKAVAAVPALEAILASEEDKDTGLHDRVRKALSAIRVPLRDRRRLWRGRG